MEMEIEIEILPPPPPPLFFPSPPLPPPPPPLFFPSPPSLSWDYYFQLPHSPLSSPSDSTSSIDVSISEADPSAPSCAICRDNLVSLSSHRTVCYLPCAHAYHSHCILSWLRLKDTCPTCRFQIPNSDLVDLLASQPLSTPRSSILLPPPPPPPLTIEPPIEVPISVSRLLPPLLPPPPPSPPPPPILRRTYQRELRQPPVLPSLPPPLPPPPPPPPPSILRRTYQRERQPRVLQSLLRPPPPLLARRTCIQHSPPRRAAPPPPPSPLPVESESSSHVGRSSGWRFFRVPKRWAICIGLPT